jgi:hypothetical protein
MGGVRVVDPGVDNGAGLGLQSPWYGSSARIAGGRSKSSSRI